MPRYSYWCDLCGELTTAVHGMSERLHDCESCGGVNSLHRKASIGSFKKKDLQKPGELVKMFIEETRQSVREEKRQLTKDYDPNDTNSR